MYVFTHLLTINPNLHWFIPVTNQMFKMVSSQFFCFTGPEYTLQRWLIYIYTHIQLYTHIHAQILYIYIHYMYISTHIEYSYQSDKNQVVRNYRSESILAVFLM